MNFGYVVSNAMSRICTNNSTKLLCKSFNIPAIHLCKAYNKILKVQFCKAYSHFFLGSHTLGIVVVVILRMHTSGVKYMQRVTKLIINTSWLFPKKN
jgi:hypothetical protein